MYQISYKIAQKPCVQVVNPVHVSMQGTILLKHILIVVNYLPAILRNVMFPFQMTVTWMRKSYIQMVYRTPSTPTRQ